MLPIHYWPLRYWPDVYWPAFVGDEVVIVEIEQLTVTLSDHAEHSVMLSDRALYTVTLLDVLSETTGA